MTKAQIAISPSMSQYFRDVVDDVVKARRIEATEAALSYVVGVLCEFAHPNRETESTLTQPLTFQLRDAMEAAGAERFRRLRALGDGVLYAAGFFGDHIEQKGVDRGYVVTVGRAAYDHASAMLRSRRREAPDHDVLAELASKFERFVEVLGDVADGSMAHASRDVQSLVKLYERWLKTGSTRLAEELGAAGLVPTRGAGGVH